MNRRDTIIIAVLVNAGLLMILFATATRNTDKEELPKTAVLAAVPQEEKEVDLVMNSEALLPTFSEPSEELLFPDELALSFPISEEIVVAPPVDLLPAEKFVSVTVKKGDFLEKIARANNTSISAIMTANNMQNTQLKIGQVLKVPLGEKKMGSSPIPSEGEYYIVKEGDSPWLIAARNQVKLEELLRLNHLDEQKAKRIRPGDKLRIR